MKLRNVLVTVLCLILALGMAACTSTTNTPKALPPAAG